MDVKKIRSILISLFVVFWTVCFHYESTRHFFLEPFFKKPLPKIKFLFPPAGWIMFYNVDNQAVFAEVYGIKGQTQQLIDPHLILTTRQIGYDNIHRNALSEVFMPQSRKPFCKYLEKKISTV